MLTIQPHHRAPWRIPSFPDWLVFAGCLFIGALPILIPLATLAAVGVGLVSWFTYPWFPAAAFLPLDLCRGPYT